MKGAIREHWGDLNKDVYELKFKDSKEDKRGVKISGFEKIKVKEIKIYKVPGKKDHLILEIHKERLAVESNE